MVSKDTNLFKRSVMFQFVLFNFSIFLEYKQYLSLMPKLENHLVVYKKNKKGHLISQLSQDYYHTYEKRFCNY